MTSAEISGAAEQPVARVVALYRYPVKSMRGESVEAARLRWHGLEGDRRFAFVRADDASGFPWLTGRQVPALVRYAPYFVDPDSPATSPVRVRTPEGSDLAVESAALLRELAAQYRSGVHLLQLRRGAYDSAALSLIGLPTIRAIGEHAGLALDPRRFRPNVLVEPLDGRPGAEDAWLGARLRFGARADSARVRANRQDERCMMINLDPETARQDPAVLRAVVHTRDECAGIYASVEAPGTIAVGDVLYLSAE